MSASVEVGRRCWCGNTSLAPFSEDYLLCEGCRTLVARTSAPPDVSSVQDEQVDLYGLNYFVEHARELGHPDLFERTRLDLSERCVHWLKALLRHRPPPARTLELGCANGTFVAMLASAGYDAAGLELSPSVAEYVRRTFDVPVLSGRLEDQRLPPGSVDVMVLMDVLEHLPDPLGTLATAARGLAPDGVLLIQTPRFDPARSFRELTERQDAFLQQLKPREHLFLLSEGSARAMLERAGFGHLLLEPAIFSDYDMFFLASRIPIPSSPSWREALRSSRSGRMVEALVDAFDAAHSFRPAVSDRQVLEPEIERLRHALQELERARAVDAVELERLRRVEDQHAALVRRLGPLRSLFGASRPAGADDPRGDS